VGSFNSGVPLLSFNPKIPERGVLTGPIRLKR
jgi:hypothetical protein